MTISGGSVVANNTARADTTAAGCQRQQPTNGNMTISGGSVVTNNTATLRAAGCTTMGGTMTISGGSVVANNTANNGGGLYKAGLGEGGDYQWRLDRRQQRRRRAVQHRGPAVQ